MFASMIAALLILLTPMRAAEASPSPVIDQGVLDLRAWDANQNPTLPLRGDWEFYWDRLLAPSDFSQRSPEDRTYFKVPGSWSLSGLHPDTGHATFRLHVVLASPQTIAFRTPWIFSASRVYADGRLLGEMGGVGKIGDWTEFRPFIQERYWEVHPERSEFDIVIQVANKDLYLTGMMSAPTLGTPDGIRLHQQHEVGLSLFTIGCILVMGCYHLALFALRRQARSTLYFGLSCFVMGIHMFFAKPVVLATFLPNLSFGAFVGWFNIWTLGTPLFGLFVHELYPKLFPRRLAIIMGIWACLVYADLIFMPLHHMALKIFTLQAAFAAMNIYTLYVIVRAIRERQDGAWIFLSGIVLMVMAFLNDALRIFFNSVPLSAFGLCAFIICQSFLLARRFSKAFTQVEVSEREIRTLSDELKVERDQVVALNENLEGLVDEKTRDIRSIMTHIQLGIFAITRDGGKVHRDYSQHLTEIFEAENLAEAQGLKLLLDPSACTSDEKSQITSAVEAMLGEAWISFELNAATLPREIRRQRRNGESRILDLAWNPILGADDRIEKILVTVRDVTELRALEEDAQDKREELQFISELLNVPPETFDRFLQSCRLFTTENRKLANSTSIKRHDMETLKILFINMHTMKGAARSLYFKKMTTIFHEVEQYYALLQRDSAAQWDIAKMNQDLDEVDTVLETYASINRDKLGRKTGPSRDLVIPEAKVLPYFDRMENLLQRKTGEAAAFLREMRSFLFPYLFTSARTVIEDVCRGAETLANDLGKARPQIVIEGEDLQLKSHAEALLRNMVIHILRNAMDHGIEDPATRLKKGKAPEGTFRISLKKAAHHVLVQLSDDGRGLDLDKIHATAIAKGFIARDQNLSLQDKANLIFLSGLTTTGQVSEISGRGVGMEAVRRFVGLEQGNVDVILVGGPAENEEAYPFVIQVTLPLNLFAEPDQATTGAAA